MWYRGCTTPVEIEGRRCSRSGEAWRVVIRDKELHPVTHLLIGSNFNPAIPAQLSCFSPACRRRFLGTRP